MTALAERDIDIVPPLDPPPIVRPQHAGHRWVWTSAGVSDPMRLLRDGEPHRWCVKRVAYGRRCDRTDTVAAVQIGPWESVQRCADHLSGWSIRDGQIGCHILVRAGGAS